MAGLTESLRLLGVGKKEYDEINEAEQVQNLLRRGDTNGVISRLKEDFKRAYFVTGAAAERTLI